MDREIVKKWKNSKKKKKKGKYNSTNKIHTAFMTEKNKNHGNSNQCCEG